MTRPLLKMMATFNRMLASHQPSPSWWVLYSCVCLLIHRLFTSTAFPGGSAGRAPTCQCRRREFRPLVGKTPWRRKRPPTPVFLPGRVHGQGAWRGVVHELADSDTAE